MKLTEEVEKAIEEIQPPTVESHSLRGDVLTAIRPVLEEHETGDLAARRMLASNHGCTSMLYTDDGELQCPECRIDFARTPFAEIESRLQSIRMTLASLTSPPPASDATGEVPGWAVEATKQICHAHVPGGWATDSAKAAIARIIAAHAPAAGGGE